ncbi:MGT family glycosyltransferase [Actinophytocola oryzae]|uniref:MGT family glycosyltransferase n=1 Tax=Actinophytocola oryzae TaxID=502181 RepID=A0A4R7W0K8_9PSEU|nr:MGT family glycosyltransferase [Actinophytocola oryzae]
MPALTDLAIAGNSYQSEGASAVKIVFASLPAYGHLYPMLPLAQTCVDAGHDVMVAAGGPFLTELPFRTVQGIQDGVTLRDLRQEASRDTPAATGIEFAARMFGATGTRYVEPVLRELFERERPDLVVYELLDLGAAVAAARLGIRAVAMGLVLWNPMFARFYELAGADPTLLQDGYLDSIPPSLQTPGPLPERRQPIQPAHWVPPIPLPAWLPDLPRKRVYVTLGTVVFDAVDVLRRAILAVAGHDVEVLVSAGPGSDPALLGELPANVHVEQFVSQPEVLRHVDLVVHHGGSGTMLGSLAEGIPQLVLPQRGDHPFNGAALVRAGAGRVLANDEQTPDALGEAIGVLLSDCPERVIAKHIATEIAMMPKPSPALLESF